MTKVIDIHLDVSRVGVTGHRNLGWDGKTWAIWLQNWVHLNLNQRIIWTACPIVLTRHLSKQSDNFLKLKFHQHVELHLNFSSSCLPDMLLLYCNRTWSECRQIQMLQEIQMVKNINALNGAPTLFDRGGESDLSSQASCTAPHGDPSLL